MPQKALKINILVDKIKGSIILVGVIKVPTISYIKIAFIHLL